MQVFIDSNRLNKVFVYESFCYLIYVTVPTHLYHIPALRPDGPYADITYHDILAYFYPQHLVARFLPHS